MVEDEPSNYRMTIAFAIEANSRIANYGQADRAALVVHADWAIAGHWLILWSRVAIAA